MLHTPSALGGMMVAPHHLAAQAGRDVLRRITSYNVCYTKLLRALGVVISIPGTIGFLINGMGVANLPPANIGYVNLLGWALIVPMRNNFV